MTNKKAQEILDSSFVWQKMVDEECEALGMAIKALKKQEMNRWIPVYERLPEDSYAVLVWCPERKNIYCAYREEDQWWIFGAYFEKVTLDVVAWMPLPQSPQPHKSRK
jgi:hypothetical protein